MSFTSLSHTQIPAQLQACSRTGCLGYPPLSTCRSHTAINSLSTAKIGTAAALVERYSDRNLGLADAANVVLAARFRTNALPTLDERDDRVVKPVWGEGFELVPVDGDRH